MSEYLNSTEEQQFNEAKNWFKQNGTPILLAICLVSGATFGWNYWKKHQVEVAQSTSATYQKVMESYLQDPSKNTPLVEKFIAEHKGSYVVFAQLEQAKQLAEKGDFNAVKTLLEQALTTTEDATLHNVIRFRLATVEYQLKNFDAALSALSNVKDKAWELRKQVLTGDILIAKGDKDAAKSAYEQAKANAKAEEQLLIDVRLNNL
ncbi:tetratricopeptide repeat protein [Ursidibacter maritimus]|uniref:YfgM family protein n=1 Tax=Ursidibacter maritimus TaxID=1331689 RepID=UPI001C45D0E7|nr:tetratricopeptide repeat protein [Ursidibacter maritimus]MBV6541104.1 tetratricopeptide repeat protein [Ursidibacter maritimus]